jgi:hypothetical protein
MSTTCESFPLQAVAPEPEHGAPRDPTLPVPEASPGALASTGPPSCGAASGLGAVSEVSSASSARLSATVASWSVAASPAVASPAAASPVVAS